MTSLILELGLPSYTVHPGISLRNVSGGPIVILPGISASFQLRILTNRWKRLMPFSQAPNGR